VTDEDGRRFHARYQRATGCVIEAAELTDTYNSASGLTMHLRFAGAIGLEFTDRHELSRRVHETKLLYGELRPGEEFYFIAEVVAYTRRRQRYSPSLPRPSPKLGMISGSTSGSHASSRRWSV
jgi:hypothetical protein